jgi:predicted nucleotidyltransferase/predicted transcriptional regulator
MDLSKPLATLTPTLEADVLAVLTGAKASFTGRQIHQIMGTHSEKGVRNALQRLCVQGIVTRRKAGASDLYSLNRTHLAAPYIEALSGLRAELLSRITMTLTNWKLMPAFGAMFGSAARGNMHPDSDIDLFIVRPDNVDASNELWAEQLTDLAALVTEWTGNDSRILELSEDEALTGIATGERVLEDIKAQAIVMFGEITYLRGHHRQKGKARRGK